MYFFTDLHFLGLSTVVVSSAKMEQSKIIREGAADDALDVLSSGSSVVPSAPSSKLTPSLVKEPVEDEDEDDDDGTDSWEQKHAWNETANLPNTDFPRRQFFSRVIFSIEI